MTDRVQQVTTVQESRAGVGGTRVQPGVTGRRRPGATSRHLATKGSLGAPGWEVRVLRVARRAYPGAREESIMTVAELIDQLEVYGGHLPVVIAVQRGSEEVYRTPSIDDMTVSLSEEDDHSTLVVVLAPLT